MELLWGHLEDGGDFFVGIWVGEVEGDDAVEIDIDIEVHGVAVNGDLGALAA